MSTMTEQTAQMISIQQLVADEAYQPRDGLSETHVRLLMASDPATWPPLLVAPNGDGSCGVIDCNHRLEAATRLGLVALPCRIDRDAGYPEAFAANLSHVLALTLAERKAFVRWLAEQEPELSYRELGRRSGLHHETVKRALEADGEPREDRQPSRPDPIRQLVRQVDRTYRQGHGRSWFGLGADGNARPFRRELEAYADEDRPEVARALLASGTPVSRRPSRSSPGRRGSHGQAFLKAQEPAAPARQHRPQVTTDTPLVGLVRGDAGHRRPAGDADRARGRPRRTPRCLLGLRRRAGPGLRRAGRPVAADPPLHGLPPDPGRHGCPASAPGTVGHGHPT